MRQQFLYFGRVVYGSSWQEQSKPDTLHPSILSLEKKVIDLKEAMIRMQ